MHRTYKKVEFGSLVETNNGIYFISIAYGKIELDNKDYYSISLASPIGKLFHQKKEGDKLDFQGREFEIKNIS